ncbi:hypothetical protein ACIQUQ_06950 [Streptomyces sp. NPDC101118]|uniref:hypothetical protein n=1 Tax=Streptomyces sp. NPDC101118 TaxID=3366109 RepID=UPI00381A680B
MNPHVPAEPPHDSAPEHLRAPEITEAECRRCGTLIAGLDGRYACGVCGWVNDHSEGHRRLPRAEEDPDFPRGRRRRPLPPNPYGPPEPAAPATAAQAPVPQAPLPQPPAPQAPAPQAPAPYAPPGPAGAAAAYPG